MNGENGEEDGVETEEKSREIDRYEKDMKSKFKERRLERKKEVTRSPPIFQILYSFTSRTKREN